MIVTFYDIATNWEEFSAESDKRYEAEQAAKEAERERIEGDRWAAKNAAAAAEYEKKFPQSGEHCLSGWNGSNRSTIEQVKTMLRDPDSFEHVETRIWPNDNGEHGLWMTYRARNGFGGMNVERIYARVNHRSCDARVLPDGPGSG